MGWSPAMTLRADQAALRCDPASLGCRLGDELPALDDVIGQDRARTAVEIGIDMPNDGYHVFVMGPPGCGKRALARKAIDARRARTPAARIDWVYVNNFAQPHKPIAIQLPPGRGAALRADMRKLVEQEKTERHARRE